MTSTRHLTVTAPAVLALLGGCAGPAGTAPDGPVTGPSPTSAPPVPAAPTTTPSTGAAPVTGERVGRCTTAELTGSLAGGDAGAGSRFATLVLTNTGTRTCELTGFPGVSYVTGDDGRQVGPAAAMDGERGGRVRLAVGGSAGAALRMVDVGNFDPAVCVPTPTTGLRVYPPGDTASLFVRVAGTGCAGTPPGGQLGVRTLTAR